MTELSDAAISFEAVKTSISQTKDGVILRLAVHPQECPPELLQAWVGARFYVAMVEIGDDETPKINEKIIQRQRLIQSAAMLCRDDMFFKYLLSQNMVSEDNDDPDKRETMAVRVLRETLGIKSRSELRTNEEAAKMFEVMKNDFTTWRRNINK